MDYAPPLVQGCRQVDEYWQLTTCSRIARRVGHTGTKTQESEDELSLARCSYFYVEAVSERFDRAVLIWLLDLASEHEVTPFDSGGIVHGQILGSPPLRTSDERVAFFEKYRMFASDGWAAVYEGWCSDQFLGRKERMWDRPKSHYCPEITAVGDENWFWEARLAEGALSSADLVVDRMVINEPDLIELEQFCQRESGVTISQEDADEVVRIISGSAVVVGFDEDALSRAKDELVDQTI